MNSSDLLFEAPELSGETGEVNVDDLVLYEVGEAGEVHVGDLGLGQLLQVPRCLRRKESNVGQVSQLNLVLEVFNVCANPIVSPPGGGCYRWCHSHGKIRLIQRQKHPLHDPGVAEAWAVDTSCPIH